MVENDGLQDAVINLAQDKIVLACKAAQQQRRQLPEGVRAPAARSAQGDAYFMNAMSVGTKMLPLMLRNLKWAAQQVRQLGCRQIVVAVQRGSAHTLKI